MIEAWFMLIIAVVPTANKMTASAAAYPTEAACVSAIPNREVMLGDKKIDLVETGDIGVVCIKGRISKIIAGDYKP